MTAHFDFTPDMELLETVRELHVLYGIAMTSRLTEPEPAISDVYERLASGIHWALYWITSGVDAEAELGGLAFKWNHVADSTDDERVAALYGSWAQNIKSIT